MMSMSSNQDKVSAVLRETVSMLCRSALTFQSDIRVQGLLGITVDGQQIFLVPIDESVSCQDSQSIASTNYQTSSELENETFNVAVDQLPEQVVTLNKQNPRKRKKMSIDSKPSVCTNVKIEQHETVNIPDDDDEIEDKKYFDIPGVSEHTIVDSGDNVDISYDTSQDYADSSYYADETSYDSTNMVGDQYSNWAAGNDQPGSSHTKPQIKFKSVSIFSFSSKVEPKNQMSKILVERSNVAINRVSVF